jgi:chromosomal replication initiation ATPase DnaA
MSGLYSKFLHRADVLASKAALEVALSAVARRDGVPISVLRASRRRDHVALRRQAIYIAVTHFERSARSVARAAGMHHRAVQKALRSVEDQRSDQSFERLMDELELECMG